MIRALQKKFVITAMIAITVLILLMLGAINVANIVIVGTEADHTLHMIADSQGNADGLMPRPGFAPPGEIIRGPKNAYDTLMSSNFFVVRFDRNGNVISADVSRTSVVTEDEARQLAVNACAAGTTSGKSGRFRYLVQENREGNGKTAVFLDVAEDSFAYLRVLLLSGTIGLACWGLMLVFVILLSKRAIRPIAENMEKQKQFVTNAGHEIKTPLAIIQSNTEAMELYSGQNKWSKNIREQTVRLTGLMNHLLMLARMDEGNVKTNPVDFSLSTALAGMVQSFIQPLEEKELSLQTDIQPDILLHADQGQIEQLVSILLDNAVKYTNFQGNVWVTLQKKEKNITLQVRNTCEQLPDVPPDKLFDRFYRADTARTQKNGGYGIGLSVARAIALANKGSIHATYLPDSICFTILF